MRLKEALSFNRQREGLSRGVSKTKAQRQGTAGGTLGRLFEV